MGDFADKLLAELDAATAWPLLRERKAREKTGEGRALRKSDRERLKQMAGWDQERAYLVDSLPRRIAFGFADFLFAEDPECKAADNGDQAEVDKTIEENRLPASLHRMERLKVSEGEAWWKQHVDRSVADVPLITWCSRRDVVPLFYGDRVLAAAFVTERAREGGRNDKDEPDSEAPEIVWRHAEIHADERVINVLYRGTDDELGRRVDLGSRPETAGYAPEWTHGLPMLAGRVVNDLDDDDALGVSEFDAIRDELLALNEGVTIASENARLTGQDRVFVAGRFRQQDGTFDASLQVYETESDDATLGEQGSTPIVAITKKYDADPLWKHITELVSTCLSRVGLVAEFIGHREGTSSGGRAESGIAIRLRFLPTTNAAKGKARESKPAAARILWLALQVIRLPEQQGGFGRSTTASKPPSVELGDPLHRDEGEQTADVVAAVGGGVMSIETGVREIHPEWTDQQIKDEVGKIREDHPTFPAPPVPTNGGPAPLPSPMPAPTGA